MDSIDTYTVERQRASPAMDSIKKYNNMVTNKVSGEESGLLYHQISEEELARITSSQDVPALSPLHNSYYLTVNRKTIQAESILTSSTPTTQGHHRRRPIYCTRYVMLSLFSLCSISSAVQWITLAPIYETLQNAYDVPRLNDHDVHIRAS